VLRVLAGEYQGRCIFRYNGIANFDQVTFLKKDLHTCGLDLAKLSDLEDRIDELVGVVVEVTLKTKGEYQNCYINKQVKVASATERAAADADASLPW
jgi:hypothetical protein